MVGLEKMGGIPVGTGAWILKPPMMQWLRQDDLKKEISLLSGLRVKVTGGTFMWPKGKNIRDDQLQERSKLGSLHEICQNELQRLYTLQSARGDC